METPLKIRKKYLKGFFIPDLLAALPYGIAAGTGIPVIARAGRILMLLRMIKIPVLFRTFKRVRRNKIGTNAVRLLVMVFWLLLTAHILACAFIAVGGIQAGQSYGMQYLQAYYWTVTTLATVGYGDITPDHSSRLQLLFTIFAQLVGVGMYGFVIGNVSNVIANMDLSKTQFAERMEKINTFLRYRKIPEDVVKRVNRYYEYLWVSHRGYEEASILESLPHSVRLMVAQEIHSEIIAKVPLFKEASEACLRDLVLLLKPLVFMPGDYIIHKGDLDEEMYFINRGSVQVVSEDEKTVYASLHEGAFFGEMALLLRSPRTATVKAADYCDVYILSKQDFENLLNRYPDFAEKVHEEVERRAREIGL